MTDPRPRNIVSEDVTHIEPHGMTFTDLSNLFGGEARDRYTNLRIHGEPYGYDGGCQYTLRGDRLENDKEYSERIAREDHYNGLKAAAAAKSEEKERRELARLKKKYPNG